MKLSAFGFELPEELLSEYPAENRDESKLMVIDRAKGTIEHKMFKDIIDYFDEGDVMVLNNTKVFPARLYSNKEKTGARIEVFLLRELNEEQRLWDVLVDPARKIRIGNKLYFGEDESLVAEVIDNTTSRGRTLRFLYDGSYTDFRKKLREQGEKWVFEWIIDPYECTKKEIENYETYCINYLKPLFNVDKNPVKFIASLQVSIFFIISNSFSIAKLLLNKIIDFYFKISHCLLNDSKFRFFKKLW